MTPADRKKLGIGAGAALVVVLLWVVFSGGEDPAAPPILPGPNGSTNNGAPPPTLTENGSRESVDGSPTDADNTESEAKRHSLSVRAIDDKGVVIERAQVGILGPEGESLFSMRRPDKSHVFHLVTPGRWTVHCYAVGFLDTQEAVMVEEDAEETTHDLVLRRSPQFPVRFLTPDGQNAVDVLNTDDSPLDGRDLFVVATRDAPAERIPRMAPGARVQYGTGLFHRAGSLNHQGSAIPYPGEGYDGVLELKSPPPVYVSCVLRETVLETLLINSENSGDLTFTVVPENLRAKLASVTVVVLDEKTREPIEKVRVTCDDSGIAASGAQGLQVNPDGEPGRFEFRDRYPGWTTFRAWAPGYEMIQRAVELKPGERLDLGTVTLQPAVAVTGTVTDSTGRGVRSVVYARDESWAPGSSPPQFGHTLGGSGNDGTLNLERLGRRRYEVQVRALGHAVKTFTLDLTDGQDEELNVELSPGTQVMLAARYPAGRTDRVLVYDTEGNLCFYQRIPGQRSRPAWLAPGTYELVTHHGPTERSRRTIEVTTENVTFDLD